VKEPILTRLTEHLTLAPDAAIDLHMHTTYSDGRLPDEQLIDYLVSEGFDLVAVTDHDRVDMVPHIQELAAQKNLPVLSGVEMSTEWQGKMGDVLCYGFDPQQNFLWELTGQIERRHVEMALAVYEELLRQGYEFPRRAEVLAESGGIPRRASQNIRLLREHNYVKHWREAWKIMQKAGAHEIKVDMAETVDAAHRSGAVCIIAHPGRREPGFTFYEPALLDQLRAEVPIDGIEVYHPTHNPEAVETYLNYARTHHLLMSTGSDSHGFPERMPRKHRAEISRELLARVGIQVK
jgi:predicted metal-dependent phosphoesterase TrpH